MKNILITGCNRGLGLGLVKEFVKLTDPSTKIIATCRNVEKAQELKDVADKNKKVHILTLDVTKNETFDDFLKQVEGIVQDDGLNVLCNNAGYSPKFTRLQLVKPEQLLETFKINTIAPILLTKALLSLLKQAVVKNSDKPPSASKALVVNMTSMLGSVEMNSDGGLYPYRCSKSALNIATKSMSIDLKNDGIMATCIHPGWVKTDMGGKNAPLDIETSTSSIAKLISTFNEEHNGKFLQYDGKELPW